MAWTWPEERRENEVTGRRKIVFNPNDPASRTIGNLIRQV